VDRIQQNLAIDFRLCVFHIEVNQRQMQRFHCIPPAYWLDAGVAVADSGMTDSALWM
jgi:hypothetical protein